MYMYVRNDLKKIKLHSNLFKWFSEGARIPLDPPQVRMHRENCNLTMADSKLCIKVCDILFMRSHEARPSNVFFIYSNIYIAPLQGSLLRGALCAGLYDVKCRYERIYRVSAKIKHSKLKESPQIPS